MIDYRCNLEEGKFYHIFNRGINGENLFYTDRNYRFFLKRYFENLADFVDTYAYCLLPNHFHLLVRIKEMSENIENVSHFRNAKHLNQDIPIENTLKNVSHFRNAKHLNQDILENTSIDVSHFENAKHLKNGASEAFQCLFTGYAKAINKQENRHGSLFEKPFKRIEITSNHYMQNLVFYIHANPQLHGITDDFKTYPWNSYNYISKSETSELQRDQVIEWFDSCENFIAFHNQKLGFAILNEIGIDYQTEMFRI
jgi:putative transposase